MGLPSVSKNDSVGIVSFLSFQIYWDLVTLHRFDVLVFVSAGQFAPIFGCRHRLIDSLRRLPMPRLGNAVVDSVKVVVQNWNMEEMN